jgi:hypothetical protein
MKLVLLLILLVAFENPFPAARAHDGQNDTTNEIQRIEARFHRAFVDADVKTFEALLTDEFVWMHGTGEIATKPQLIESFRSGKARYKRDDIDNLKVTLYGSAAVVVGHNVRELGTGEILDFNYTTTYVKQGGDWRVAVFHSSHCPCK